MSLPKPERRDFQDLDSLRREISKSSPTAQEVASADVSEPPSLSAEESEPQVSNRAAPPPRVATANGNGSPPELAPNLTLVTRDPDDRRGNGTPAGETRSPENHAVSGSIGGSPPAGGRGNGEPMVGRGETEKPMSEVRKISQTVSRPVSQSGNRELPGQAEEDPAMGQQGRRGILFGWVNRRSKGEPGAASGAGASAFSPRESTGYERNLHRGSSVGGASLIASERGEADTGEYQVIAQAGPADAKTGERGFLGRLFGRRGSAGSGSAVSGSAGSGERNSEIPQLDKFPRAEEIETRTSKAEDAIDEVVEKIRSDFHARIERIAATDLDLNDKNTQLAIPRNLESAWYGGIQENFWRGEERIAVPLREAYARALMNSDQVRVLSYFPLIGETGIVEADSQFDPEVFAAARYNSVDRPTNSILDTGQIGRFLEEQTQAEAGIRKRFSSGAQMALSNRFSTLENNSEFTIPNPQTTSDLVLSVRQPLLKGGGYDYNRATLKIAKLEAETAAGEYIRGLEEHLLEVNRAYWGVYLGRAAYLLRKSLAEQTEQILDLLETRSEEATASELLRARSELSRRRTEVTRAEMAVRNAEERLRAMVNDPGFPIGGGGEFVPVTRPVLDGPDQCVKGCAREAIQNRAEVRQEFDRLRATGIVKEAGKRELLPQLDAIGEVGTYGIGQSRQTSRAYDNMFENDPGWIVGLEFSQPWERRFAKARQGRRDYEFLQQCDKVSLTLNRVLLESVVAYRELLTAYRDMQGRYQETLSTREEINALRKRLDVDIDNKQTVAYRLQLIMDALERNQFAEERFLVSVVSYNIAFAELDRAKGTFLNTQDVTVTREAGEGSAGSLETLKANSPLAPSAGSAPPG